MTPLPSPPPRFGSGPVPEGRAEEREIGLVLPGGTLGCRAVLFDMDGVLVDSLETVERHLREWALRHGLDPQRVVEASPGRTNAELIAEFAPALDAVAEARLLLEREVADLGGIAACPGAARLVARLPDGAWAVVTSGDRPVALARLEAAALPVPDVLVTADDVRAGKPDPEGYLAAARRLGVPPSACVVVEDATAGLLAARAAGMRAIAVSDGAGGPHAPCDHVLDSLLDLRVAHPAD